MIRHVNIYALILFMLLLNAPGVMAQQVEADNDIETQDVYCYFEITDDFSSSEIRIASEIPEGLNYRIQIACFRNPVSPEYFKGITPIYGITNGNAEVKVYYAGMFRRVVDAQKALAEVMDRGFGDSFILCFSGDSVISAKKAAMLEEEWGITPFERIVKISVSDEPQLPETEGAETETEPARVKEKFLIFYLNQPNFLVKTLIVVIIISIIFQFASLVWILINRNKIHSVQRRTDRLMEQYQTLLVDYLFSENDEDKFNEIEEIATSEFNKKILINQMIDLSINLSGEAKEKLRNLYLKLRLDWDSVAKAYSNKWHIQIKGFKELAFMNIRETNWKIRNALKSNNDILRMEAQLALIRLNESDPFKFLDDLQKPFTLWEQLNVHELITFHNLPIPDFSRWTNSLNKTVVIFSLRMIQVFKQNHAVQAVIACLEHSDNEVRHTAIKVCGEIHLKETLLHLKHMYKNEDYNNCLAIVQAMGKMPDESVLGFLKLVLDKEEDAQLQIEAALSITKMGETGISALVKLMKSEYKNYQIIIRHVLDKRIS